MKQASRATTTLPQTSPSETPTSGATIPAETFPRPSGQLFGSTEQENIWNVMQARRDVRGNRFTQQAVSDEDLNRILDAALVAPSVGFSQPWRFIVIEDANTKQAIADIFADENTLAAAQFEARQDMYRQLKLEGIIAAPLNIAVYYEATNQPVLGQTSMPQMGEYSVVCAVQNMWLMARTLNLGMGWVSILDPLKVNAVLGAQPHQKLVAYLCLGHVDEFYSAPELERLGWEKRQQRSQLVHRERFPNATNPTPTSPTPKQTPDNKSVHNTRSTSQDRQ